VLVPPCYREGVHAKEHYLICGVQGDFTQSLVNDPPVHVWTRQLKVRVLSYSAQASDSDRRLDIYREL
jgi:hypothetical protein